LGGLTRVRSIRIRVGVSIGFDIRVGVSIRVGIRVGIEIASGIGVGVGKPTLSPNLNLSASHYSRVRICVVELVGSGKASN